MDGQNSRNDQDVTFDSVQTTNNYQNYTPYMQTQTVVVTQPKQAANGLSIAGLVLGILSLVSCCCLGWLSLILSIAGMICSIIGRKKNPSGVATAGLVCSILGLIFSLVTVCASSAMFAPLFESYSDYLNEFESVL